MAARKLELHRRDTNSAPYQTNEMFIIGISNVFGLEAWNSCTQAFQGPLEIRMANNVSISLTNAEGFNVVVRSNYPVLMTIPSWDGFVRPNQPTRADSRRSLKVPLYVNDIAISNSIYRFLPTPHLEDI